MQNALEINDLRIRFRAAQGFVEAVRGVSFSVGKGEIVALVGASGSGKTAIALAIQGFLPKNGVAKGRIFSSRKSDGLPVDLLAASEAQLQKIRAEDFGAVFQEPMASFNPVFRTGDQVAEKLIFLNKMPRNEARSRVLALYEKVKLDDPQRIFDSFPHQLSGGQKQRAMIAMALASEPSLLIADEPTTALDSAAADSFLELLKELNRSLGLSILLISHDLRLVERIADRAVVLRRGLVEAIGRPADLLRSEPFLISKKPIVSNAPLLLEVKNLALLFRKTGFLSAFSIKNSSKIVFENISFELRAGETVGIFGPSGSGKTSLVRSILRLIEPTGGSVFFEGADLSKSSDGELLAARKKIQIIFQDSTSALPPKQAVGESLSDAIQLFEGKKASKEAMKSRISELLRAVGLSEALAAHLPRELSGGQRQRVCIARALSAKPKILICDEIAASLDEASKRLVFETLLKIQVETGLAMLVISHDRRDLESLCDRILELP